MHLIYHMASDHYNINPLFVADLSFLTAREKHILLDAIGDDDTDSLMSITVDDIRSMIKRDVRPRGWVAEDSVKRAAKAARWMYAYQIEMITDDDGGYPPLLREIPDRPFALFCRGNVKCLTGQTVSVVGTRHVTPQGKQAAQEFSHDASAAGVSVVSGLAMGVDGAAHMGTVEAVFDAMEDGSSGPLGKAIAILPCGVDTITPTMHKRLASNIMYTNGCLVSEYLPGAGAEAWRFVHRNRIIAGMSKATLVVEAPPGSGALITAQFAVEYDRDVVFHAAAFSDMARQVSDEVKAQLQVRHAQGKVSKAKLENTAQKYIDDGAPVIKDWKDFCECMDEAPGARASSTCDEDNMLFDGDKDTGAQ